jgi:hypothetical protein
VPPQHAGTGPPHNLPDLLPHFRAIAVDRTLLAGWFFNISAGCADYGRIMLKPQLIVFGFFLIEKGALFDPLQGVILQRLTFRA